MATTYPYKYDSQFESYINQIMRVFSGFQVKHGTGTYRRVPVRYGNMSRVVAHVLNNGDSLTNHALPTMSVHMRSLEPDTERKRTHHHIDAVSYTDENGVRRSSERIVGPAFTMGVDVDVYAANTTQLFEILEQVLLVFNPRVTFQTDTDAFNSDYISELSLTGLSDEVQYPLGSEKRTVMYTMSFDCPVRLRYPMDFDASLVETIKARIYGVDIYGNTDKAQILDEVTIDGTDV